ncbi:uncharacterized protein [Temnothorax nylanderi]|uniref:uncharacterized protein n=1 Tax=Temnothorax nylanderi TaxID=102681 RepID=UPI003A851457
MAKIELEKAKAIALSPAADNKQIGQDVDLTCSNKSSLAIQKENNKLTGTTVDYTCSNEPQLAAQSKRNDDVFSPELLSQTPTSLENVGTLCLVEEIVHLSKTFPANNASEESSQTEECEMFPATDNQHTNLFVDQMSSNTTLKTMPTKLSASVSQNPDAFENSAILSNPDAFENSAILSLTPISLTNLTVPEEDNSADFNNSAWDWDDIALNVYKSVLPLQKQNNDVDERRDTELPIPNCCTSEDANRLISEVSNEPDLSDKENDSRSSVVSNNSSDFSYVPDFESSNDSIGQKEQHDNNKNNVSTTSQNISTDLDASLTVNKVGHSAPDDVEMFVKSAESGIKKNKTVFSARQNKGS